MSDDLTDADLLAIARRLAACALGPWRDGPTDPPVETDFGDTYRVRDAEDCFVADCGITDTGARAMALTEQGPEGDAPGTYEPGLGHPNGRAHAAFVAHARTDVPKLLGEVVRLRARLAKTQAAAGAYRDAVDEADRAWAWLDSVSGENLHDETAHEERPALARAEQSHAVVLAAERALDALIGRAKAEPAPTGVCEPGGGACERRPDTAVEGAWTGLPCLACNGSGEGGDSRKCGACAGTGEHHGDADG